VLRREQPDYAVISLEGGPIFREEMYADYKAHRGPMPDDLRPQVARVQELIGALNIPIERLDGYEADDVIGSLSRKYGADGEYRVVIVTGDSDLLQLVDDDVTVVLPGGQRFEDIRVFDRAAVEARYGFAPERVADYKALVGDTSDNIPGVPGIGDKTAKALIGRFGGIEEIIARAAEIEPARARNAVGANAEAARLSLRLATIVRDLPVELDLEKSAVGNYQRDDVIALLRELEFGPRMLSKLPEARPATAPATKAERPPSRRTIVRTADDLARLAARVREVGAYAVDTETDALDSLSANLVGIAIGVAPDEGAYIPVGHELGNAEVSPDDVRAALLPLLTDDTLRGYAHHAKYDLEVLQQHGYDFTNLAFETMLAAFLLGLPSVGLKELAFNRLGREMTEILELIGPKGRNQLTMNQVNADTAGDYAAADVEATFELADLLRPEIEREGMATLLYDIEQPLVPVLAAMEEVGIAVDAPFLEELAAELTARSRDLEREIYALAGREFKINSPQQLSGLLFDELKLPPGRRTKTGYSVDADVLEAIRERHPIVELILEHRALAKFLSTYVEALPKQVSPRDGRVHTSYSQTVAATGRLSSSNPNLQNIPIRTAEGRRIRRAFIADHRPQYRLFDDAVLLSADYSQIELRLLAHLSGEPFLVDAFQHGDDIHRATASIVYAVSHEDVTADMRRVAKTVNFGVLYGMQAFGLSRDSGLSREDARKFIDEYWARLPKVREFFDATLRFGVTHGYVVNEYGRRRYLPDLTSPNGQLRMAAERQAINAPLQGQAADIMKLAMIRLAAALRRTGLRARILLQVHDELVLEVDRPDLDAVARLVRDTMQDVVALRVPLVVDVRAGQNWAEMDDVAVG
ncbi:MAG TPA: DNA polymerase I, partial [Thermomicrobiales bacterium]|nr:DNA polymerase I [Thermomicrobiales bacterium]